MESPFRHAFVRLNLDDRADPDSRGSMLLDVYRAMMHRVQIDLPKDPAGLVAVPYNLLVTARWMLVIPRSHECFGEISLNSLAFLGALLVQDNSQLEQLRQAGPFAALSAVTLPPV